MLSGTAFSTGGYSAEYGQALSSILVLNTKQIPEEETFNIGLMSVGADLAGTKKWENGAISASTNYMNLAPYMELAPQNQDWNKAPESIGASLNLRQNTAFKGIFKLYGSADQSMLSLTQSVFGNETTARSAPMLKTPTDL